MMEPFQRLPAEIIRAIVQYVPDFVGLHSLFLTSKRVRAVLQSEPSVVLLDDLAASNSIVMMPDIRKMLEQVASMHPQLTCCGDIANRAHLGCEVDTKRVPSQTPSTTLLEIIQIAAQIQRLACTCLTTMQEKFCTAVAIHLTASVPSPGRFKNYAMAPSWIEEYRVHWALWHLRLYSDLQNLARKNAHSMNSSVNPGSSCLPVERLDTYADLNGLVAPDGLLDKRIEEIWSVAAVLADLGLQVSYETLEQKQQEPPKARWFLPPQASMPLCMSFELPQKGMQYPVWCPSPMPSNTDTEVAWGRSMRSADCCTVQSSYFRLLSGRLIRWTPAVCDMQDLRPYRRLGTFIWDKWRIYSAGLIPNSFRKTTPTPSGGFIEPRNAISETTQEMQSRWTALVSTVLVVGPGESEGVTVKAISRMTVDDDGIMLISPTRD